MLSQNMFEPKNTITTIQNEIENYSVYSNTNNRATRLSTLFVILSRYQHGQETSKMMQK